MMIRKPPYQPKGIKDAIRRYYAEKRQKEKERVEQKKITTFVGG